ncbi:hypothetical protein [Scytonema sp. PCC 10023]|uniref:hypothetical protein n=1 Tax=Scytonema sp. PCC 10023 TaxID=1680591 RepID=UPI0039C69091
MTLWSEKRWSPLTQAMAPDLVSSAQIPTRPSDPFATASNFRCSPEVSVSDPAWAGEIDTKQKRYRAPAKQFKHRVVRGFFFLSMVMFHLQLK